eukprot:7384990-Alexandrium_andersonii.AAC.1
MEATEQAGGRAHPGRHQVNSDRRIRNPACMFALPLRSLTLSRSCLALLNYGIVILMSDF